MAKLIPFRRPESVSEQCAKWIAKIDRGLSAAERDELGAWLAVDPVRRHQMFEMAKLWDDLEVLDELSGLVTLPPAPVRIASWFVPSLLAIGAVAGVTAVLLIAPNYSAPTATPTASAIPATIHARDVVLTTAVGEYRSERLADGSIVQLNTDSALAVDFASAERRVELERGEAQFNVEHDAQRPFVVTAGDYLIRAVGTAFNVRLLEGGAFEVTVTEGRVRIAEKSEAGARDPESLAFLDAGETARYDGASHSIDTLTDEDVRGRLAWQRGMLVFKGESLETALAEVTRHTGVRFEFADDAARRIRLGGYFRANDVDGLTQSLQQNFSIDTRRVGSELIIVSSKPTE